MKRLNRTASDKSKSQSTISSFFRSPGQQSQSSAQEKRPSSPIDLTIDSDTEVPPSKRQRTASAFFSSQPAAANASSSSAPRDRAGFADHWRFTHDANSDQPTPPHHTREHERAKRILKDSSFFRRRNEVREDPSADGADDLGIAEETDGDAPAENTGDESDAEFSQLLSHFSNSNAKGKGKASAQKRATKASKVEIGPSGEAYTPLELQIRDLKAKYPGILLMVEVGYKIIFYEDDARIASKELGIMCYPKRNFMQASIPVHRKEVHLKKLLSQGYKVGIVEQTETAALKKVGDNRGAPFTRELNHLYTSATYVDALNSVDDLEPTSPPSLMCLVESLRGGMSVDERVSVAIVVITPSTGDVIWDEFEDNSMRIELETRMVHMRPQELLLPASKLSRSTEKLISYTAENAVSDQKIRIERYEDALSYTDAFSVLSKFYADDTKFAAASEGFTSGKLMASIADFPKQAAMALAHSVQYLSGFGVEDCLLETKFFAKFTERTHMLLNGNTLTNLEIYRNETDYTPKGSLMWILDRTTTKFGARTLRQWVGRPLVDSTVLRQRAEAIDEIIRDTSPRLTLLRQLLKRLPDLARGLCRIQYGKCTPQELAVLLRAFERIAATFNAADPGARPSFKSQLLNDIFTTLPKLKEPILSLLEDVDLKKASEGDKEQMWSDLEKYPEMDNLTLSIQVLETELMDELKNIRKILKKPALTYTANAGEEYLIEVKKNENREIPPQWTMVSGTRSVRRFRTPELIQVLAKRAQCKEALAAEAQRIYLAFLKRISQEHYGLLRDTVNKLAVADCLLSLAQVALLEGYTKPVFTQAGGLEIVEGRHPMVEVLTSAPFVPNTVRMGEGEPGSIVITGPNMGGKSSAVRMIALCAIMAQIGSYVPAKSMKLGLMDSILTRMGASDELSRGRSTFMVEMQETSDILHIATSRSLVILDELGRGTSTFDGMAVASAVLQHLVENRKCKTLFITHYPHVAIDLERRFPHDVRNMHMGFTEDTRIDGTREVTFLYRLTPGITTESFGVECARLAGLPESILRLATEKARSMQDATEQRIRRNKLRRCVRLVSSISGPPSDTPEELLGHIEILGLRDVRK